MFDSLASWQPPAVLGSRPASRSHLSAASIRRTVEQVSVDRAGFRRRVLRLKQHGAWIGSAGNVTEREGAMSDIE
jgi:hypothetical protein